jgi:hypothetical protein
VEIVFLRNAVQGEQLVRRFRCSLEAETYLDL